MTCRPASARRNDDIAVFCGPNESTIAPSGHSAPAPANVPHRSLTVASRFAVTPGGAPTCHAMSSVVWAPALAVYVGGDTVTALLVDENVMSTSTSAVMSTGACSVLPAHTAGCVAAVIVAGASRICVGG